MDLWIIFGLCGAFLVGLFNIYQKKLINVEISPIKIAVQMHLIGGLIGLPILIYLFSGWTQTVIILLALTGLSNGLSFWFLAEAYGYDSLSIIAPLRGVTPLLVAFIEPLVFQELQYERSLIIASIVVALGLYILLYEDSPLKSLKRINTPGVLIGILSAAVISVAVLIDRYAMTTTDMSPVVYAVFVIWFSLGYLLFITAIRKQYNFKYVIKPTLKMIPLGFFRFTSAALAISALTLIEGTRLNILWQFGYVVAAIFGGKLLGESNLLRRGIGAILILLATVIVIVSV